MDVLSGALEDLPVVTQALPTAQAAAAAEPCTQHTRTVRQVMRVLHKPHVMVRAAPSLDARAVGYRQYGALLSCVAQRGDWLLLQSPPRDDAAATAPNREEWVLAVHPELGKLLQRAVLA